MSITASCSARKKLCLAITATLATFTTSFATAQQNTAGELEEIQVTGSRVRLVDGMTAPTPVTAITTGELRDFDPGTTVAAQLDKLPQFFDTPSAQRGGNAISSNAGGSYLNLRGMGLNRTLVLLDGTRVAPADAQGAVNVDLFPSALVQRIDVVTGGASAAYGADAVAGVVNFVLDREFEGLRANVSTGITEKMNGENYNFNIAGGKAFMDGRLNVIASVEARQIDQIGPQSKDRLDNWMDWGLVRNPAWVSATATPGVPQRITKPYVFSAQSATQGLIIQSTPGFAYRNWTFTDDGKGIRPYAFGDFVSISGAGAQNNQSGGQEYKYYDQAFFRGPRGNDVAQRSGFLGFKFEASDRLTLTAQMAAGRSESNYFGQHSNVSIAGTVYAWKIFRDNAYLPAQLAAEMDRLNLDMIRISTTGIVDGPGLINIYDNRGDRSIQQQQMYTVGFNFDINDNWNLNGAYQYGESDIATGILNVPRTDKFFMAMDAVRDPATGQIVCNIALRNPSPAELSKFMEGKLISSPLDPFGVPADSPIGPMNPKECVPFNPFGLGNANQAAKDWILDPEKKQVRSLGQDFAELLLTGVLFEGWGAGPISLAAGLTWRDESFDQFSRPEWGERGILNVPELGIRAVPDGFANDGNRELHPFSGIGAGSGSKSVWEWYSEINVPIWEWDSGQNLGSSFAYRSSDYSLSGRQESWKVGLDAQLLDSLRWRATKSSDIREPNFAETFLTGTGGGAVVDPFRNNENSNGLTVLATSNPTLGAEIGDTITTGFVWQPTFAEWIDGLSVSLDWYEVNLEGAVALYGAQRIVDDCFATGAASACNLLRRLPSTDGGVTPGPLSRILNQNINAAMAQTRGVDFEAAYRFEPNFFANQEESFSLRALVGYLGENSTTTAAGATQDNAGSQTRPEFSGVFTGNYNIGSWGFMLQSRYYDSVKNNILWVEGRDVDDNWIASQTTFNSAISYQGEMESGSTWRASFNITNLFDREPSIVAGANGQSIIAGHDVLGRRYQLSLNMDF
jgi:iron complex outermembrane recepter protein